MKRFIEELWLRSIRLYTYNTPISKGKYRLFQTALSFCSERHEALGVRSRDGRRFSVNLTTGMQDHLFFFGEYETAISRIAGLLIGPGDVCIDVGANFGWYTTLMASKCGPGGEVHSFEPVPQSFRELQRNVELFGSPQNIYLNECALGNKEGAITITIAQGEPTGHASIAAKSDEGAGFECAISTLDKYLAGNCSRDADFVKVDIEGAEMMFLEGAGRLFQQERPPVFQMEMALAQSKHFGYLPDDLIKYIGERGEYEFFKVDEAQGRLVRIEGFANDDIGANVFCIPRHISLAHLSNLIEAK